MEKSLLSEETILCRTFFIDLFQHLSAGASCTVITDDSTYKPQSLFFISLDFDTKNVSMVESLEGFPDIVGEQLLTKVQENDGFNSSHMVNLSYQSSPSLQNTFLLAITWNVCSFLFFVTELDIKPLSSWR